MELPDDPRSIRSHVAVHVVASDVSGWFVNPDDMSDANIVFAVLIGSQAFLLDPWRPAVLKNRADDSSLAAG